MSNAIQKMMEAADKASKATAVSSKRNRDDNDGGGGPNPKKSCIVPEAVSQDISKNIGEGPTRPSVRDSDYPSRVFSNTRRKFLASAVVTRFGQGEQRRIELF